MAWIDDLFLRMLDVGASDLHLTSGQVPKLRIDGDITPLEGAPALSPEQMKQILCEIAPARNQAEYDKDNDTDFAYELPGKARFRANMFMDRKGPGGVFRVIPTQILTAEQLGLPPSVLELCKLSKGLVVVTGPTGSGKSTTLAAMVDYINKTRSDHIITIEDPIEFVHQDQSCLINQREVHHHTNSFKRALRAALREDPDIVLVGEMRDLETIEIAIETAETGHLVFGTLHTTTAVTTVDRIIDQFPADRQAQIRTMLSSSLKGVIAQTLCKKKPKGRVAALEILIANTAVASNIRDGKTHQLASAMQMGGKVGMRLLNDALFELVQKGLVDADEAYLKAVDKEDLANRLRTIGANVGLQAGAHAPAAGQAQPAPARPAPQAHPQAQPAPARPAPQAHPQAQPERHAAPHPQPAAPLPKSPAPAPSAAPSSPAADGGGANPFTRFRKGR